MDKLASGLLFKQLSIYEAMMSAGTALPDQTNPINKPVFPLEDWLEQASIGPASIRIVIHPGGGHGNQKAAFTLMRKLREQGFAGHFDVCCLYEVCPCGRLECGARLNDLKKIQSFVPAFNPENVDDQNFIDPNLGELYFRKLPHSDTLHAIPFVPLAITAAEHPYGSKPPVSTSPTALYHCANYIRLNPTGWNGGEPRYHKKVICTTLGQVFPITDHSRLAAAFDDKSDSAALPVEPVLFSLLETIQEKQRAGELVFDLMYGLFRNSPSWISPALEIQRMINATSKADLDKATVIVIPYKESLLTADEKSVLMRTADVYTASNFSILRDRLHQGALDKKRATLVFTGKLPEPYFEKLATQSLVTVAEGCNLVELMESTGHPYIHGGRNCTTLLNPTKDETAENCALFSLHARANHYLEDSRSSGEKELAAFICLVATQDPRLAAYLQRRHELYLKQPDMVEEALQILQAQQPDSREVAYIQSLMKQLASQISIKKCSCLDASETIPLSRIHQFITSSRAKDAIEISEYFRLIEQLLEVVSTHLLREFGGAIAGTKFQALAQSVIMRYINDPAQRETMLQDSIQKFKQKQASQPEMPGPAQPVIPMLLFFNSLFGGGRRSGGDDSNIEKKRMRFSFA